MTVLLYGTIWIATFLFVAGEAGKRRAGVAPGSGWAWRMWATGALLCAAHMLLAMGTRHGWSHADAVQATVARAAAMYGVGWRGSLHVNYLFLTAWIAETAWWKLSPAGYARRPTWIRRASRVFYFIVLVNAAVVFASPAGRAAGAILILWLLWTWRPRARAGGRVAVAH